MVLVLVRILTNPVLVLDLVRILPIWVLILTRSLNIVIANHENRTPTNGYRIVKAGILQFRIKLCKPHNVMKTWMSQRCETGIPQFGTKL